MRDEPPARTRHARTGTGSLVGSAVVPRPPVITGVTLREVVEDDLPAFFDHQLDPLARSMAAFTPEDDADRVAFMARWERILRDDGITTRAVLHDGSVAGHIAAFGREGRTEVTYWIDRSLWGRGIATAALGAFLRECAIRPLHARAAADNLGSIRVLEKWGFVVTGRDRAFAHARAEETDEVLLTLE